MKFLALYKDSTLPLLRRVKAPFSALAERGHSFTFMQVDTFSMVMTYGSDVTILPNWVFTEGEYIKYHEAVNLGRIFVYDLSDPRLLDNPMVWQTLADASLVTVPNARLQKEVEILHGGTRCAITPSCVDVPYFMHANTFPDPQKTFVGCFGDYDWSLLKDIASHFKGVTFLTDGFSAPYLLGDNVEVAEVTPDTYPLLLRSCVFGLCPSDGPSDRDEVVRHEYGILSTPTLQLQVKEQTTEMWVASIRKLLAEPRLRAELGRTAFLKANEQRAVMQAGEYMRVFRKKLPLVSVVA